MERNDYYVYTLSYPESMGGAVFYVGKGAGNRIAFHEWEAKKGVQSRKCDVIRTIWVSGGNVVRRKVYEQLTEEDALLQERSFIASIGWKNLANQTKDGDVGAPYGNTNAALYLNINPCIPTSLSLTREIRLQMEECMFLEGLEVNRRNSYEYLRSIIQEHFTQVRR